MRWNCPHCGTHLGIADDKMSTSWSFSRCYQCAGYALIRKSEVNIIKVDRAPAGEKVLLPESSENPLLSEAATRTLNRYTNSASNANASAMNAAAAASAASSNEKSVVKPATRRNTNSGFINPLKGASPAASIAAEAPANHELGRSSMNPISGIETPSHAQPFAPASQDAGMRPLAGPNAPAGASVDRNAMPAYMNGVNNVGMFPDPLPEVPANASRMRFLPMAIGVAAAFALGSGLYILMQSGEIIEKSRPTLSDRSERHTSAPYENAVVQNNRTNEENVAPARPMNTTPVAKVAQNTAHSAGYSDQVRSQAMAPERQLIPTAPHPVQLSSENPPLIVMPKAKNIHLRSGPGMVYPVVGNADEKSKYVVTDWNDRWFKVLPQAPGTNLQNGEEIAGWIRTDSVQVVPMANATATN